MKRAPVILLAVLLPVLVAAQPPFRSFHQERLTYSLSSGGLGAADAEFTFTRGGRDSIHVRIDTRPWSSLIFSIHNRYHAALDTLTGLLLQTGKDIRQRNIAQSMTIHYDYGQKRARSTEGHSWPLHGAALDLFSMLYHLRTLRPDSLATLRLPVFIEGQSYWAEGAPPVATVLNTPWGALPVTLLDLVFVPADTIGPRNWKTDLLTNRIARPGGRLTIALGPAPQHLPLRLIFGGDGKKVTMTLKSFSRGGQ